MNNNNILKLGKVLREICENEETNPNNLGISKEFLTSTVKSIKMDDFTWRWCEDCRFRIYPNEVECVDIKMIDGKLYCKTCAHIIETGDIYYEGED